MIGEQRFEVAGEIAGQATAGVLDALHADGHAARRHIGDRDRVRSAVRDPDVPMRHPRAEEGARRGGTTHPPVVLERDVRPRVLEGQGAVGVERPLRHAPPAVDVPGREPLEVETVMDGAGGNGDAEPLDLEVFHEVVVGLHAAGEAVVGGPPADGHVRDADRLG
ncbi:hypothetical protein [Micromonospora sp. ATA51]|uniref:hypothetical protein n=1 Tax=Micromonospora sp. ATA51 TaxID=2806098 RepID=UPI001EE49672|nr:hypothetical protein [Micromonospora sp. ATA51]